MDDDDDAAEAVADSLGGADIGAHVDVLVLGSDEALVQGVEHYGAGRDPLELLGDVGDQEPVLGDQVRLAGHDIERHGGALGDVVVPAQGLDALLVAVGAFEGAIDDGALADVAVAILPPHGDVQHEVERPEAFEAFRLAPHIDQAGHGNELVDQVERLGPRPELGERDQAEAPGLRALGLAGLVDIVGAVAGFGIQAGSLPRRRSPMPR